MKVKSESEAAQSCPTLSDPMDCSPPGSSVHGIFQTRILEWGAIAFAEVVSNCMPPYGLQPARLLCSWNSSGKNTGVVCHFLLQEIFLTEGSNPSLLHYRQMLYHLSHQGSLLLLGPYNF